MTMHKALRPIDDGGYIVQEKEEEDSLAMKMRLILPYANKKTT